MRIKSAASVGLCSRFGIGAVLFLALGCATEIQEPGDGGYSGASGSTGVQPGGGRGNQNQAGSGTGGGSTIIQAGSPATNPDPGGTPQPSPMDLQGEPVYRRYMRLTHAQWERAVQDLLKLPEPSGLSSTFEQPVQGSTDFDNNEHVLIVNKAMVDGYQAATETLVTEIATDSALSKIVSGTDSAAFVRTFGRRAFRRPLTDAEFTKYQALYTTGSTMEGTGTAFSKGASLVIQAMLQSPNFLYRSELAPKGAALNGYEMASKLSFIIRGTTPTDADLDAAASGKLDSAEGAAEHATRMLEEPAAAEVFKQFHGSMLHFSQYNTIDKTGVPEYRPALNADYETSSYMFFDRIFKKNLGLKDILTSTIGFVSPALAPFYGVTAPASGFAEVDLGPDRPGYFTQLPYLTLHGLNADPDSILRGRDINLGFLCITLGPPAAVPAIPALKPGQTNRERISDLTSGCGGACHNSYLNPIGFAFEAYDGMGRLRTTDNGKPVDASGSYPFAEGLKTFSGPAELMAQMAEGSQAHSCYSKKLASFMLQRSIVASDIPLLETMQATSKTASVKELIVSLVKNPAFRTRAQ